MFYEAPNDYQVIMSVTMGKRPRQPSNDICLGRGLDDELWALIESYWATELAERPSASKIVEHLCPATNGSAQQNPPSDWDKPFVGRNVLGIAIKVLRVYLASNTENTLHLELKKGNRDVGSRFKSLSRYANYVYVCFFHWTLLVRMYICTVATLLESFVANNMVSPSELLLSVAELR